MSYYSPRRRTYVTPVSPRRQVYVTPVSPRRQVYAGPVSPPLYRAGGYSYRGGSWIPTSSYYPSSLYGGSSLGSTLLPLAAGLGIGALATSLLSPSPSYTQPVYVSQPAPQTVYVSQPAPAPVYVTPSPAPVYVTPPPAPAPVYVTPPAPIPSLSSPAPTLVGGNYSNISGIYTALTDPSNLLSKLIPYSPEGIRDFAYFLAGARIQPYTLTPMSTDTANLILRLLKQYEVYGKPTLDTAYAYGQQTTY